jgi:hypothetical protein
MVADYTSWGMGATGKWNPKTEAKKNLRIRAGWCKRQGTKCVPNNLTNQYLWDLDCGLRMPDMPVRKRKGMNPSATSCVNYPLLLQIHVRQKKTCASAQVGVNLVINSKVDFTYQYLWDPNSSNRINALASEQSQQRIAKCKQRFSFSISVLLHSCALTFAKS